MDELTRAPERLLIDCFRALDEGASSDDCLARYPQQASSLRGVLDTRAQLLTLKTTAPSPTAFASGREALLARVVRPLASSHPGSMETQGRQARGLIWRPATRVAFAGALLFAMASCAIGVAATPAADKVGEALPDIPTIDVPRQPYPFPQNEAAPGILPTAEPVQPSSDVPADSSPQPSEQPAAPIAQPSDSEDESEPSDTSPAAEPTKPSNPGDGWLPPINAQETDPPDIETPEPANQQGDEDASEQADDEDKQDADGGDDGDGGDSSEKNPSLDQEPKSDGASEEDDSVSDSPSVEDIVWPDADLADVSSS